MLPKKTSIIDQKRTPPTPTTAQSSPPLTSPKLPGTLRHRLLLLLRSRAEALESVTAALENGAKTGSLIDRHGVNSMIEIARRRRPEKGIITSGAGRVPVLHHPLTETVVEEDLTRLHQGGLLPFRRIKEGEAMDMKEGEVVREEGLGMVIEGELSGYIIYAHSWMAMLVY